MDFIELFLLKKELSSKSQLTNKEEKLLSELNELESIVLDLSAVNESLGVAKTNRCPTCKRTY